MREWLAAALSGTQVSGVTGLYGYYGSVGGSGPGPTSPQDCIDPDAPPFLVVHGARDTLVLPQDARGFADQLRAVSRQPVVYAELPGAQLVGRREPCTNETVQRLSHRPPRKPRSRLDAR